MDTTPLVARMGALAFSLGLGAAVASGAGVAGADTGDAASSGATASSDSGTSTANPSDSGDNSDDSNPSSSTSPSTSQSDGSPAGTESDHDTDDLTEDLTDDTDDLTEDTEDDADLHEDLADLDDAQDLEPDLGQHQENPSEDADLSVEQPPADDATADETEDGIETGEGSTDGTGVGPEDGGDPETPAKETTLDGSAGSTRSDDHTTGHPVGEDTSTVDSSADSPSPSVSDEVTEAGEAGNRTHDEADPSAQIATNGPADDRTDSAAAEAVSTTVAAALVSPIETINPFIPASGEPLLFAVVTWLRREVEEFYSGLRQQFLSLFFNKAPTAAPLQFGETVDGVVLGSLGAVDTEGDTLHYTVVRAPESGMVVVHRDGTFSYTANPELAAAGGTDTFEVRVSDSGMHLHLNGPAHITVPVTVSVGAGAAMGIGGTPTAVAASPDGSKAYIVDSETNSVKVYDVTTRTPVGAISVGAAPVSITVSADGSRAYVVNSHDRTVSVIDTETLSTLGEAIGVGDSPTEVAVSPDGATLYVTNSAAHTISVIDTDTSDVVELLRVGRRPYGVALSDSGDRLYVTNEYDNTVSVIDTTDYSTVATIEVGVAPTAIAIANGRAYVTNTGSWSVLGDGSVSVIDLGTNAVVGQPIAVGEFPIGLAASNDGRYVFVANRDHDSVSVIDTTTGTVVDIDPTTPDSIEALAVGDGPMGLAVTDAGLLVVHAWDADVSVLPIGQWVGSAAPNPEVDASGNIVEFVAGQAQGATAPGAAGGPAAAAAAAGDSDYESASSHGTSDFTVYNNTTSTLQLTGFASGDRPVQGSPAVGTMLAPGESAMFTVNSAYWNWDRLEVQPVYTNMDDAGETFTAQMYGAVPNYLTPSILASSDCSHAGGTGTCSTNGTNVYFQNGSTWEADSSWGSKRFDVYNLTQYALTLQGYNTEDRPQFGAPSPGDVLLPGESASFEINRDFFEHETVGVTYVSETGETWSATMVTSPESVEGTDSTTCSHSGGSGSCTSSGFTEVDFLDAPNTTISVAATTDEAQRFSDACASSAARCVFKVSSVTEGTTEPIFATKKNNYTADPVTQTLTFTQSVASTSTLTLSAKASTDVLKVVSAEVSESYSLSSTTTTTKTDTVAVTIDPGTALEVYGQYPISIVTGDLTVLLGNTAITLTDATFNIPIEGGAATYSYVPAPLDPLPTSELM